jgi:hypothetical protein
MSTYEDDTPRAIPEYLKGLTHEQRRERIEKLFSECQNKPIINQNAANA